MGTVGDAMFVELRTPLLLRSVYLDSRTLIVCMHLGGVAREEEI
jgi:hypothetical protein